MALNYLIPFAAYIVIASPTAYKTVRGIAGAWVANAEGLPTIAGLVLHAIVFIAIVGFLMNLLISQKSNFYGPKKAGEYCDNGNECYHTCYGGKCN
jgi:hypothetical protein